MSRVEHRYQGFRTLEEAKKFNKGLILTPGSRGSRRREYELLGALYLDTKTFPYVCVWNERAD